MIGVKNASKSLPQTEALPPEDTKSILEAINKHFGIQAISLQGGGKLNGGMLNSVKP